MVFTPEVGVFYEFFSTGKNVVDHVVVVRHGRAPTLLDGVEEERSAIVGILLVPQVGQAVEEGASVLIQRVEELIERVGGLRAEAVQGFQDVEIGRPPSYVLPCGMGDVPQAVVANVVGSHPLPNTASAVTVVPVRASVKGTLCGEYLCALYEIG
jgi:hypothetical protein